MAVRRLQDVDVLGREERLEERETFAPCERIREDLRMRRDPEELVEDAVGQVPRVRPAADAGQKGVGGGMLVAVGVRAVEQQIRVDQARQLTNP